MISKEKLREIKKEIRSILMVLYAKHPFYAFILRSLPIYAYSGSIRSPAFVTEYRLFVSVDSFLKLPNEDRIFVLIHEANHILMKHSYRTVKLLELYNKNLIDINAVADAKVNQFISAIKTVELKPIMPGDIELHYGIKNVERKSFEEVVRELPDEDTCSSKLPLICDIYVETSEMREKCKEKGIDAVILPHDAHIEEIVPGAPEFSGDLTEEEAVKYINQKMVSAYVTAKLAGKVPGDIEELVKGIMTPMVDWRSLLRFTLRNYLSSRVRRTYARPNRKLWVNNVNLIPGKKLYGGAKALVLLDTSGSISPEELRQFVTEIYAIFRYGNAKRIEVIPWDAKVYGTIELNSYFDIEKIRVSGLKVKGRGGTIIGPALEKALVKADRDTCVIIMSDFVTSDSRSPKIRRLMRELSKRASKCIMLTTYDIWDVEGWEVIKIQV